MITNPIASRPSERDGPPRTRLETSGDRREDAMIITLYDPVDSNLTTEWMSAPKDNWLPLEECR